MAVTAQIAFYEACISASDADGIGSVLFRVSWDSPYRNYAVDAVRLIVLACNLGGGFERAIELIRADIIRQQEES